jgi:hypothetical protein
MRGVILDRAGHPTEERADPREVERASDIEYLKELHEREWKPRLGRMLRDGEALAAGGQWYNDTRAPFAADDFPAITLSTTSLMLWPAAIWSPTYATDWYTGKRFYLYVFGKMTTAATPGNLTVEIRYGTTDAGGVLLATSAAVALTASKTTISWQLEAWISCRDIGQPGTNGSLFAHGFFAPDQAGLLIPAANNPMVIPASAAAAVASDTTITSGLNIQFKRSGSTAETATVQDLIFVAMN